MVEWISDEWDGAIAGKPRWARILRIAAKSSIAAMIVKTKRPKYSFIDIRYIELPLMAKDVGLDAFETACELTLETGVVTGSIVLNEMRRLTEPTQPKELNACHHLKLNEEPKADFQRYDHLLGAHNVH